MSVRTSCECTTCMLESSIAPYMSVGPSTISRSDMVGACRSGKPFQFGHFLMLCKTSRLAGKGEKQEPLFFSNPEEELVLEVRY